MPRRRRNNSRRGGRTQKKAPKADPEVIERPAESPVKNETDNKQKEVPEKPKVTITPTSSVSTFKINQVPPRKRKAAFIIAHDSNDVVTPEKRSTAFVCSGDTGTHLLSTPNSGGVKIKDSPENSLKRKELASAPLPLFLNAVKREKFDGDVTINGGVEGRCNNVKPSIKTEELKCGVHSFDDEESQPQNLTVNISLPTSSLTSEIEMSFNAALPNNWFCKPTNDGFNIMLLSSCKEKAIQRRVFFPFQGEVEISVHRKMLPSAVVSEFLKGLLLPMFLSVSSWKDYVDRALQVVYRISSMEVCKGADQDKYQNLWLSERTGVLDSNPYGESSYIITFRSSKCQRLSMSNDCPCEECVKLLNLLRRQYTGFLSHINEGSVVRKPLIGHPGSIAQQSVPINENISKSYAGLDCHAMKETKGHYVAGLLLGGSSGVGEETEQEPPAPFQQSSLEVQCRVIENDFSIPRVMMLNNLEKSGSKTYTGKEMSASVEAALKQNQKFAENSRYGKIKLLLEKSAVLLENELSQDLLSTLKDLKDLTPVQQQFIDMQKELASEKRASGMKWLPTLIRYALFMKSLSVECTGSGMITLPSGKVLFNFSQVLFKIKKEFQKAAIKEILNKPYLKSCILSQTYNVLLMDEIDVSDNLVYQKSNGELIGFVKLSDVKDEMDRIEDFIVADKCFSNRPIPSYSMLVYMVKGMSCSLKEVVALLDAEDVSPQMVYDVTWNIISTLEQHCIKVIGVVNNGFPRTKSFLDLHTGVKLDSGQIYLTKNIKANDRPLFFFTDASYLLKQIRNCFEESGSNGFNKRILTKNKETIAWKTIERLYLSRKWRTLKGSNVFLNEYSRKKASHASAVFSPAVAGDLQSRFWPNTSETVFFLSKVHDTFSALLNTDVVEGRAPAEPLSVYTSVDDKRFAKMLGFLDYLSDWKTEVDDIPIISDEDKSKLLLDDEIYKEVEMTLRAFVDVSIFLLKDGVKEIDPNVFWLEPIGQYLEKGWFGFVQTINSYIKRSVNYHSSKQTSE